MSTLEVPLFNGRRDCVGVALIDEEDMEVVSGFRWFIRDGYASATFTFTHTRMHTVYMHRLIVRPDPGLVVDHINGNRLDNRRCNLRAITQAKNLAHRVKPNPNATGAAGVVRWSNGKYAAYANVRGRCHWFGTTHETVQHAAVAVLQGRMRLGLPIYRWMEEAAGAARRLG